MPCKYYVVKRGAIDFHSRMARRNLFAGNIDLPSIYLKCRSPCSRYKWYSLSTSYLLSQHITLRRCTQSELNQIIRTCNEKYFKDNEKHGKLSDQSANICITFINFFRYELMSIPLCTQCKASTVNLRKNFQVLGLPHLT